MAFAWPPALWRTKESATVFDSLMAFLDQHQQSYLAWSWGAFDCAKDPALLTDWLGTPSQTYGQGFKDHLTALHTLLTKTP